MIFNNKKNVLIVGGDGMFGYDLSNVLRKFSHSKSSVINNVVVTNRCDFDPANKNSIKRFMEHTIPIDYIVNCAGFTDVNKCDSDDFRTQSFVSNVTIPASLAEYCYTSNSKLIHISTNQVFSNIYNGDISFKVTDVPSPANYYGMQKLLAEKMIENALDARFFTILRTSWLYGMHRNKSFIHKVIKRMKEYEVAGKITGVCDEYSIPTSTLALSIMVYNVIKNGLYGYHNACSIGNEISRIDYMKMIINLFMVQGFFSNFNTESIEPVYSKDDDSIPFVGRLTLSTKYPDNDRHARLYDGIRAWDVELSDFIMENAGVIYDSVKI